MRGGDESIPIEIEVEVGELIAELHLAGWAVYTAEYDAKLFGNWYVDLARGGHTIRLVKDRSQYMVAGPPTEEIKAAGLWKAFDDFQEFRHALIKWAI